VVGRLKHPKRLIGKRLPDLGDAIEVENDGLETLEMTAGNETVVCPLFTA